MELFFILITIIFVFIYVTILVNIDNVIFNKIIEKYNDIVSISIVVFFIIIVYIIGSNYDYFS